MDCFKSVGLIAIAPLLSTRLRVLKNVLAVHCMLEVLGLEFTLFVVAERLVERDLDTVEHVGALLEDVVHFLEGAETSFGEEEVDAWEHECVAIKELMLVDSLKRQRNGLWSRKLT